VRLPGCGEFEMGLPEPIEGGTRFTCAFWRKTRTAWPRRTGRCWKVSTKPVAATWRIGCWLWEEQESTGKPGWATSTWWLHVSWGSC